MRCYQESSCLQVMLPAITVILFLIGACMAVLTLFVATAVNEHSKKDLSSYVTAVWFMVGLGGLICAWQTLEVVSSGVGLRFL